MHADTELHKIRQAQELLYKKGKLEEFLNYQKEQQEEILEFLRTVIPSYSVKWINTGTTIVDILSDFTGIFNSRSDARKAVESGSISICGEKITNPYDLISGVNNSLVDGKYYLIKFGKRKYYLIINNNNGTIL